MSDTTGREAAIHINHIEGAIGHLANHCDGVYCSSLREAIDFISRHSDSRVEVLEKALQGLVSAIDVDPYECPQCGSRLPFEDVDKNSLQHNDGCELHAARLAIAGRREPARDSELEREFRQHEALAAECERAGTDYSKGRAYGIREVIHYARLAIAGRKEQP